MPKLNFANVDAPGFQAPPKGWYNVEIEDVDVREVSSESKHPGNEFWNVTMNIIDGAYADRKLFTNIMLPCEECAENGGPGSVEGHDEKDYSPFMLLGILQAVGKVDPEDEEAEIDIEAGELEGMTFQAYARPRKDDDSQAEVKKFRALDDPDSNLV